MDKEYRKTEQQSITDRIRQTLLRKILSGELKKGDKLPSERELSAQMGISRSSLHQAIVDLEVRGFLKIVPRHGTVVCDYRNEQTPGSLAMLMSYGSDNLDFALFKDLMDTRRMLEVECVACACRNIYDSTLVKLNDLVTQMEHTTENPSELIYKFHYYLVKASGNSIYCMIYRGFEPILQTLIKKHYDLNPEDLKETIKLNKQLIVCIMAKDEEGAKDIVKKLLYQGSDSLKKSYESITS